MVAGGGGGLRLALLDGGRCGLIHGVMIVLCVYVWVDGVCVCVCVRERERECPGPGSTVVVIFSFFVRKIRHVAAPDLCRVVVRNKLLYAGCRYCEGIDEGHHGATGMCYL